jgi:TonB-dependent starch-binding outer membrane protein SusC
MKKKHKRLFNFSPHLKPFLRIMKVYLFLAIISVSHLFAETVSSQALSLNVKGLNIREVFKQIEQQTDYSFFYNDNFFDPNRNVVISEVETDFDTVMTSLLKDSNLSYRVIEGNIVVISPNQQPGIEVTGLVRSTDGESIPGATIIIKGTTIGATTDINGRYSIRVPDQQTILLFSFIGMETQEITVGERSVINVTLVTTMIGLDEIVVTGYSVRQRSQPTGAITRVGGEDIRQTLIQSPDQALQGRMSGVLATHTSGQPGSGLQLLVRGRGSITASSAPIFIIDGVQVRTDFSSVVVQDNPLTGINPDDIESIEVLKDASATALYGAQGANGVVLITTRQAKRGETRVSVSSQFGVNEQPRKLNIMDGPTWTETMIQGYVNYWLDRGGDPVARRQEAIGIYGDPATAPTYDWQEELTRSGAFRNVNFSVTSGQDRTRIFLSGGYDFEEGAVLASDFSSFRLRSNVDHRFSDRFTVATRLSASNSVANGLITGSANINSPFHGGYTQRPIDAIYTPDGGYNHNDWIRVNLVQQLNENIRQATTKQLRGSVTGIYQIRSNLAFRSLWGVDYRTVRDRSHTSALLPRYAEDGGSTTERFREVSSLNTNQILEFSEKFEQHNVVLLGGFEYRQNDRQSFTANGRQFPNPIFYQLDLAAEPMSVSGGSSHSKFAGFFTRADYNYDYKYFLTANLRYDGSSRFGEKNKWGLFYSGAFAWEVTSETFMENLDFINQLKFKVGYGITGNSEIGDFVSRSLFGAGGTYNNATGLRPAGLGNDMLTWEEAHTLDIGFDFSVFKDRFFGTVNYFNQRNKNLLLFAWLPTDSGFSGIDRNTGEVKNTGIELELGGRWISTENFSWTTNFNYTYQSNEITNLVDGLEFIGSTTRVGYPLDIIWNNKFAGINPADGRPFWYDLDGNLTYTRAGADMQMLGKYSPDYFGGMVNQFKYKRFTLTAFVQYEFGRSTTNQTVGRRMQSVGSERGLMARVATLAWQQPGDVAQLPKHYWSTSMLGSSGHDHVSLYVKDASYIRFKEVRLDYSLPRQIIEKAGIKRANVFVQGRNLYTWTTYPFGDPEVDGESTGNYPQSRQIAMGINLEF